MLLVPCGFMLNPALEGLLMVLFMQLWWCVLDPLYVTIEVVALYWVVKELIDGFLYVGVSRGWCN
jgi:hypothetical protein